jgi:hypothetical protein
MVHLICRIWQLLALKSVCVTQLFTESRICEANVRALPVRVLEFARDTPTFSYFRMCLCGILILVEHLIVMKIRGTHFKVKLQI